MVDPNGVHAGANRVEPERAERVGRGITVEIREMDVRTGERPLPTLSNTVPAITRETAGPGVARSRTTEAVPPTSLYPSSRT